jgi:hypothetical protein
VHNISDAAPRTQRNTYLDVGVVVTAQRTAAVHEHGVELVDVGTVHQRALNLLLHTTLVIELFVQQLLVTLGTWHVAVEHKVHVEHVRECHFVVQLDATHLSARLAMCTHVTYILAQFDAYSLIVEVESLQLQRENVRELGELEALQRIDLD